MLTPLRPGDNVTMALARLKAASPNLFGEMVKALTELYNQRSAECVQAPPDGVLKAQGRALQVLEIVKQAAECTEDARALEAKFKPKEKT